MEEITKCANEKKKKHTKWRETMLKKSFHVEIFSIPSINLLMCLRFFSFLFSFIYAASMVVVSEMMMIMIVVDGNRSIGKIILHRDL